MLNRWIEDDLLEIRDREGVGCFAFSPLVQLNHHVGALAGFDFSGEELAAIDRHAVGSGVNLWAASSGV